MNHLPHPGFRAFTIKHNGPAARIITEINISEVFDPKQPPDPLPALHKTTALWDTGASRSVLTPATVKAMCLIPTGATTVMTAGGCDQRNTYLVNFYLPNRVLISGVLVSDCAEIQGNGFGALIGMDIISTGDLSLTNVDQKTWMSFRIPSIQTIDYVEEADKIKFAGIQRNDPCPCGSKKKFKYCHGAKPGQPV